MCSFRFFCGAVDNAEPFYNILGGAQDLGTLYGPSRTMTVEGVRNQDWWVPLGADGYHVAFDPEDPDIFYLEFQQGMFFRYDKRSHELISIRPEANDGVIERWNWDVPIVISPHSPKRIYYASQRLWRSDDRGNSWTAVSGDLTRNLNRYELEIGGRVHAVDELYDNGAMSQFCTISHLSESPVVEGLIYVGTDDGLIQVTEDGGKTWRAAVDLPTAPTQVFIQAVQADVADPDTVFAVADAHKIGDYSPYVYESNDRGKSWRPISGNLPHGEILWALQQDHVNTNLLFLGAETGIYTSLNRGESWHKLAAAPTIAFRDIKIQRRDGDLVGATFGRGFYVLDDYTPLRDLAGDGLATAGHVFPIRDAWWYVPQVPSQSNGMPTMGATLYKTPNPDFGATITYYLKEGAETKKEKRNAAEKKLKADGKNADFPGWDTLTAELNEADPQLLIVIKNEAGEQVRRLSVPAKAGLGRIAWDLRLEPPEPIILKQPDFRYPWEGEPQGPLAAPGTYSAELMLVADGKVKSLGEARPFVVKPVPTAPDGTDFGKMAAFQKTVSDLLVEMTGAAAEIGRGRERLNYLRKAVVAAPAADTKLFRRIDKLVADIRTQRTRLIGSEAHAKLKEPGPAALFSRIWVVRYGSWYNRQEPTQTMQETVAWAESEMADIKKKLTKAIDKDLVKLEKDLAAAGAPWTPGRKLG